MGAVSRLMLVQKVSDHSGCLPSPQPHPCKYCVKILPGQFMIETHPGARLEVPTNGRDRENTQFKFRYWASESTEWVKALAAKSDLISIP